MPTFIKSFFSALGFLTVVPVPGSLCGGKKELSHSMPWFVVVGVLIGAVVSAIDYGLCRIMPLFPASCITAVILIAASGGLHMDGLADTADGFFSSRPRDKMLHIMRDSRVGAMGVIAIAAMLLIKVSLLSSLLDMPRMTAVFLAPVAGRFAPVFAIVTMKYVRGDSGLGTVFKETAAPPALIISLFLFAGIAFLAGQFEGLIAVAGTLVAVAIFSFWCIHKIGGWTGDTVGASVEISEMVVLLVFVIIAHLGIVL